MDISEQLRILNAAEGDPAKLAIASVDLAYSDLPDAERSAIKNDLQAVSIPHWCDEVIMADLLDIPRPESVARLARLRRLNVVEPFPARGSKAVNVHEATRLALRKHLSAVDEERFRTLSARVAAGLARDISTAGRIEWVYHLLCAEPDRGADELEKLHRFFYENARPEARDALAISVSELTHEDLLQGAARIEALLCIAEAHVSRGEEELLEDPARRVLELAQSIHYVSGEARARTLLGDAYVSQGKLVEAEAQFEEYIRIFGRLAKRDSGNSRWPRGLAVVKHRLGMVFHSCGKLAEAEATFREAYSILRHLADQYPTEVGWQVLLAHAYEHIGVVLQAQERLPEALSVFCDSLAIWRRVVEQDPGNSDWQRGLASWCCSAGDLLYLQGHMTDAHAAYQECLAISRKWAYEDPRNLYWQLQLAAACSRVGEMLLIDDDRLEARVAYCDSLAIHRRLAERDPHSAVRQRGFAVACVLVARLESEAEKFIDALQLYEQASGVFNALLSEAPASAGLFEEIAIIKLELEICRRAAQDQRTGRPQP